MITDSVVDFRRISGDPASKQVVGYFQLHPIIKVLYKLTMAFTKKPFLIKNHLYLP